MKSTLNLPLPCHLPLNTCFMARPALHKKEGSSQVSTESSWCALTFSFCGRITGRLITLYHKSGHTSKYRCLPVVHFTCGLYSSLDSNSSQGPQVVHKALRSGSQSLSGKKYFFDHFQHASLQTTTEGRSVFGFLYYCTWLPELRGQVHLCSTLGSKVDVASKVCLCYCHPLPALFTPSLFCQGGTYLSTSIYMLSNC